MNSVLTPPPRSIRPQAERVASTLGHIRRVAAVAMYAAPIAAFLANTILQYESVFVDGNYSPWAGIAVFLGGVAVNSLFAALLFWMTFGFIWFFAGYFGEVVAQLDNSPRQESSTDA